MGGGKGMPWLGGLVLLALAAGVCVRRRVNA
jgi:MYXO-CTERM domain-containing protein